MSTSLMITAGLCVGFGLAVGFLAAGLLGLVVVTREVRRVQLLRVESRRPRTLPLKPSRN